MNPRILLADDHEIVRDGIRRLFERSRPAWEICGEASNSHEAVDAVRKLHPDIIVLDITMPGASGLDAAARIAKLGLSTKVLIFTMHDSERLGTVVRESGAHGYVLKNQAARDLIVAVEKLLSGGTFFGASEQTSASGPLSLMILCCQDLAHGLS